MDSENIQQLSDDIYQKICESLSDLSEVFQKYSVSEGIEVEFRLNTSKIRSSDVPDSQKVLLKTEGRKISLEIEFEKALLEIIEPQKFSLKIDEGLRILRLCSRNFQICPTGAHPNGNCWHFGNYC